MRTIVATVIATLLCTSVALAQNSSGPRKSLYDRLGGLPAIKAVVDDFVGNVARDKRINRYFANADIPRLKKLLVEQICQASGGPCTYSGRDMKTTHRGMGIAGKQFDALVQDLGWSLRKFKVPAREQKELVGLLAPMKKDIVERKSRTAAAGH